MRKKQKQWRPSLYNRMAAQFLRDIPKPSGITAAGSYCVGWFSGYRAGQRDEQAKLAAEAGPFAINPSEFYWEIYDIKTNLVEKHIEKTGEEDEGRPYAEKVLRLMNAKAKKARKA